MTSAAFTTATARTGRKPSCTGHSRNSATDFLAGPSSLNPHGSDPTNPREDYTFKSKGASARWSGSGRAVAKVKTQALAGARRNKAALLRGFEVSGDDDGDDAEQSDEGEWELVYEDFGEEDYMEDGGPWFGSWE